MPNLCFYQMKLKGTKADRDSFIRKMKSYDEPDHFFRIFQVIPYEETDEYICIEGDCAWSIYSCCISGYPDTDLLSLNSHNLELEIYSSEPGIGFEEHYIYSHGKCIASECVDMREYFWDRILYPEFNQFKLEYELPDEITADDFTDEILTVGGFDKWQWNI